MKRTLLMSRTLALLLGMMCILGAALPAKAEEPADLDSKIEHHHVDSSYHCFRADDICYSVTEVQGYIKEDTLEEQIRMDSKLAIKVRLSGGGLTEEDVSEQAVIHAESVQPVATEDGYEVMIEPGDAQDTVGQEEDEATYEDSVTYAYTDEDAVTIKVYVYEDTPVTPTDPDDPDGPDKPVPPTDPDTPVNPDKPITPDKPVPPTTPVTPTEPVTEDILPSEPAEEESVDVQVVVETPRRTMVASRAAEVDAQAAQPTESVQPAEAAQSTQPTESTQPTQPIEKVVPKASKSKDVTEETAGITTTSGSMGLLKTSLVTANALGALGVISLFLSILQDVKVLVWIRGKRIKRLSRMK